MHWKKIVKPDSPYFGEQDFATPDETVTVTIKSYATEKVTSEQGTQLKGVLHFKEQVKPLILNVTNGKAIAKLYGKDMDGWIGKPITLYYDPSVRAMGQRVGGTRVKKPSAVSKEPIRCEACGGTVSGYGSMSAEETAAYTRKKYGRALCADCATKAAQEAHLVHTAQEAAQASRKATQTVQAVAQAAQEAAQATKEEENHADE